jgi:hypothetical protein
MQCARAASIFGRLGQRGEIRVMQVPLLHSNVQSTSTSREPKGSARPVKRAVLDQQPSSAPIRFLTSRTPILRELNGDSGIVPMASPDVHITSLRLDHNRLQDYLMHLSSEGLLNCDYIEPVDFTTAKAHF